MVATDTVPEDDHAPGRSGTSIAECMDIRRISVASRDRVVFDTGGAANHHCRLCARNLLEHVRDGIISPPPPNWQCPTLSRDAFAFQPDVLTSGPRRRRLGSEPCRSPKHAEHGPVRKYRPAPFVRVPQYSDSGSPDPVLPLQVQPTAVPSPDIDNGPAVPRPFGLTRIANPSTTVPQGALIQAVLETALDFQPSGICSCRGFTRCSQL